jgi:hypothetical protein
MKELTSEQLLVVIAKEEKAWWRLLRRYSHAFLWDEGLDTLIELRELRRKVLAGVAA